MPQRRKKSKSNLKSRSRRSQTPVVKGEKLRWVVGQGYDVHRLVKGRRLVLGGVDIPSSVGGLLGHSDADVLCHAVADACLGAFGLGDIGEHFPPSQPKWKNISSLLLLDWVRVAVEKKRGKIMHIDATVIAQEPKIAPYRMRMKAQIAAALRLPPERVSVKATTPETLGALGRREGIAAMAVALGRY
jgi:2-C-methyl-D-erythritol 2,4-cyclodiphosphate synthase